MIFVECRPDRLLVRVLGVPKDTIRHVGNKPEVYKMIERYPASKGVVDEDPDSYQPPYLHKLRFVEESSGLRRLRDERTSSELVLLCPRMEEWVIEAAKEVGIHLRAFGLPDEPKLLHAVINAHLKNFETLLLQLKGSERMRKLHKFLCESE